MPKLTKSYVHGVNPTPLLGLTVGQLFDRTVQRCPGNEALVVRRITHGRHRVVNSMA
jgi:fatty-acyl-CoA synthase